MSTARVEESARRRPLRLWPGVVLAIALVLLRYVLPTIAPDVMVFETPLFIVGMLSGIAGTLLIAVWWLLFSRAPWLDRVGAIGLMAVALLATSYVVDESISNGFMGMMLPILATPILGVALVAAAVATRHRALRHRRAAMAAAILVACASFTLVRTGGISGSGTSDIHWRWTDTPEDRLLAQSADEPPAVPPPAAAIDAPVEAPPVREDRQPAVASPSAATKAAAAPVAPERMAEWPGFRGAERDGVIRGVRLATDWAASPPVELWRKPIGPGWSSFAVRGDLVFTQEQRGDDELVSCYRLSTGEPVWRHRDAVRFWESNGGAGPRATPTLHGGRVYTLGATGVLNALDAATGATIWSRNAAADVGKEVPGWGFAASPLVIDDLVVVALASQLAAYDVRTGKPRWIGPPEGAGYSSPHLVTIAGVRQILLLRGSRTTSFAPADGTVLWEHTGEPSISIVQPVVAGDGTVLVAAGDAAGGLGIRRVAVARGEGGWTVDERWQSRGLKPYFNDFVVHKGYAFGFDGSILSSIDLADGTRKWKGGRYGNGQMVLLPDQDLLLVVSEEGEIALVSATPGEYRELARVPAIDGKTWNHPVLVGDVLLVRNGEEMAAFRLPLAR